MSNGTDLSMDTSEVEMAHTQEQLVSSLLLSGFFTIVITICIQFLMTIIE